MGKLKIFLNPDKLHRKLLEANFQNVSRKTKIDCYEISKLDAVKFIRQPCDKFD
jgi:hypothetical protein